jgi:hypothetical protein
MAHRGSAFRDALGKCVTRLLSPREATGRSIAQSSVDESAARQDTVPYKPCASCSNRDIAIESNNQQPQGGCIYR